MKFVANILRRPGDLVISLLNKYSKVSVFDPVVSSRNVEYINICLLQIVDNVTSNTVMTNEPMSQHFVSLFQTLLYAERNFQISAVI
jgi:hypothetical protein